MMDINLQDALAKEIKKILKGYQSVNKNNELSDIHVFTQSIPKKKTDEEENTFPYVLVWIDEEGITDEDSDIDIRIYLIIGIIDRNTNMQGYRDVLNIANLIYQHLFHERYLEEKYQIEYPVKIKLFEESIYPEFAGGIETNWKIKKMEQKEDRHT